MRMGLMPMAGSVCLMIGQKGTVAIHHDGLGQHIQVHEGIAQLLCDPGGSWLIGCTCGTDHAL